MYWQNIHHKAKIECFAEKCSFLFIFKLLFLFVFFSLRDETEGLGYHKSLYDALQSLRDKEFSAFYDILKDAR